MTFDWHRGNRNVKVALLKANDDGLFVFKPDGGTIAFSLSDAFLKDLKSKL